MDLVSEIVVLPLAPLRALLAVARILEEEAEQERNDPARVRREIEDIEAAQSRREISDEAAEQEKRDAVGRLVQS
jgi:Gas vesicle protein G